MAPVVPVDAVNLFALAFAEVRADHDVAVVMDEPGEKKCHEMFTLSAVSAVSSTAPR